MRNFGMKLWQQLAHHKDRVALIELDAQGQPQQLNYGEWFKQLQRAAVGLMELGLEPGQRVGFVAQNCQEWLTLAVATWIVGGCVVPLVPGRERRETLRCLARSGCDWIVVRDLDGLDTLRGQAADLPEHLQWIVLQDGALPQAANLTTLSKLVEQGRFRLLRGADKALTKRVYDLSWEVPALILFDPDRYDDPHGAYYSAQRLSAQLEQLSGDLMWTDARVAAVASYGWLHPLLMVMAALLGGHAVVGAPTMGQLLQQLGTLGPTHLVTAPSFIEGQAKRWRQRLEQAPDFLRKLAEDPEGRAGFSFARALGGVSERAAQRALYEPIRQDLGAALIALYVIDGHLDEEVYDILSAIKVQALGIFGLPECGISHMERPGASQRGSVGRPVQGYACKIEGARDGERGQVLIRGESLYEGYWDKRGPRQIEEGWLRTGVRGAIQEGYLVLEPSSP